MTSTEPQARGSESGGGTESLPPYVLPAQAVLAALGVNASGLRESDAMTRLDQAGPNRLPPPARQHVVLRFLKHFDDVLIYILLAAAVLKAIMGDWVDFTVILVVAVVNAVVGFVQEGQAERALDGIRTMLSMDARVRRDGAWVMVDAERLVPGDVLRVQPGDKVPADTRLIEATNLQVDEAALTGESEPVEKTSEPVAADAGIGDRSCMLYSGTIVTLGAGVGVVTATGAATEIGRIQTLIASVDHLDTPLTRQLAQLGKVLSWLILGMAGVMLVIGRRIHDFALPDLVSAAIGFAVAAIPEGLPALVTITLALGVQQMAHRNAITRKLTAVETLGSVTTICSDKTGTLTKNEMTARTVVTSPTPTGVATRFDVAGLGYAPEGSIMVGGDRVVLEEHPDLRALLVGAAACIEARIMRDGDRWRVVGQPTEGALAALAAKAGLDIGVEGVTRVAQIPFDSAHKFSATLDRLPVGTRVHVVGAPDRLLERSCRQPNGDGGSLPLDVAGWEAVIDDLGGQGLRVLAIASGDVPDDTSTIGIDDLRDLTFLGVVGIVDPPRPEAVSAIADCHAAGISVKMITGDHAGTAVAIARELGIVPPGEPVQALTGAELEAMTQEELRLRVEDVDVYARTSPEHKIRIVRALQSRSQVVAMTGDGVNDAPALTRADVGIAMGVKGTEATKESAEIVLADDNFATIERAVEEGRRIYDNIRKSVVFLLPTNGAQSLVILVAVLFGLALPLSPVQILWVNLVTAVTLSLALAYEPAEPGIMARPPRRAKESVVSLTALLQVILASLVIGGATLITFSLERDYGSTLVTSQTTSVTMLAVGQTAYLFNCRFLHRSSFTRAAFTGNRVVWIAIGSLFLLQLVFVYAPFMHDWFDSSPIGPREWGITLLLGVGVFVLAEASKVVARAVAGQLTAVVRA